MAISLDEIKKLKELTGVGLTDAKKALVEADGDIDKAVDILRTMGIAKAVKRAGRDTNEGTIATYVSEDGKTGAIIEVNSETDFVAKNDEFIALANGCAALVADKNPADVAALSALPSFTLKLMARLVVSGASEPLA